MAFRPIPRNPVYVEVAGQIRDAIRAGELVPGEPLPPERELSVTFGVSRTSVREALRALEAQGLVEMSGAPAPATVSKEVRGPARDALINLLSLNRVEFGDVIDFRCLVETKTVRLAAAADPPATEMARAALEEMRVTPDVEAYDVIDTRFHVALAKASGNGIMHLVVEALRGAMSGYLNDDLHAASEPQKALDRLTAQHAAILEAVESRDAQTAGELMEQHVRDAYRHHVLHIDDDDA